MLFLKRTPKARTPAEDLDISVRELDLTSLDNVRRLRWISPANCVCSNTPVDNLGGARRPSSHGNRRAKQEPFSFYSSSCERVGCEALEDPFFRFALCVFRMDIHEDVRISPFH